MKINWIIMGIVAVLLIALILFMAKKNRKEKNKLTDLLNNDFNKSDEDEAEFEDTANEK